MARVSDKALRPRQYIFTRLSTERIAQLAPGVQRLLEQERSQVASARAARAARERNEAARHAENIMAGLQTPDPESDSIRALQKELDELLERKKQLFAQLKKSLDSEDVKREAVQTSTASFSAMPQADAIVEENGKQVTAKSPVK